MTAPTPERIDLGQGLALLLAADGPYLTHECGGVADCESIMYPLSLGQCYEIIEAFSKRGIIAQPRPPARGRIELGSNRFVRFDVAGIVIETGSEEYDICLTSAEAGALVNALAARGILAHGATVDRAALLEQYEKTVTTLTWACEHFLRPENREPYYDKVADARAALLAALRSCATGRMI